MASRSGSRRHRIRKASLVVLGAFACDLGVEPPPDKPLLAVSAREVNLFVARGSSEPDEVTIEISNNGSGELSGLRVDGPFYDVGGASGWLDTMLVGTTLTLSADGLTATGETLETDSYQATVDIVADGAANSPRTITVNLEVGTSQQIALSVDKITFAAMATNTQLPPRQTVTISNGGDGVLSALSIDDIVYDGERTDWLALADTLLEASADTVIELWPEVVPESADTLHATVIVWSRFAEPDRDSIQVEYIVAPPPTLVLSATSLALEAVEGDATPMERKIALWELNGRPLAGLTVRVPVEHSSWLQAPAPGDKAPATLTIIVDPSAIQVDPALPAVDSVGSVFVSSSAGVEEEVEVLLRVRRGPTVHLSMETVRFTMSKTGRIPLPQDVRIENSGAGTLDSLRASVSEGDDVWLNAWLPHATDPGAACDTAPCDLELKIIGEIEGANETAEIEIASRGGMTTVVAVDFVSLPGPSPVLSSNSVTFRSDVPPTDPQDFPLPPMLSVAIANTGTRSLLLRCGVPCVEYLTAGDPWLDAPVLRPDAVAPTTLELRPSMVPGLPGEYRAEVILDWGNDAGDYENTLRLPVVFEVGKPEGQGAIGFSSESVHFRYVKTDDVPTAVIGVENLSTGSLRNLEVVKDNQVPTPPDWLNAELDEQDPPTVLRLSLNTTELGGSDSGDVIIREKGGADPQSVTLPVTVEVAGPELVATSESVAFRAYRGQALPLAGQTVTIANGGSGSISISAAPDPDWWLSGEVVPGSQQIVIRPITTTHTSLDTGVNSGIVRVESDAASPLDVAVDFELVPGPTLAVSHPAVRLSGAEGSSESDTASIAVRNWGEGTLAGLTVSRDSSWLSAKLDTTVAPAELEIVATPTAGMVAGRFVGTVSLSSPNETVNIPVTFDVAPAPEIQVSPAALVFHADANTDVVPPAQMVTVFDPAGGPSGQIAATVESDTIDWLGIDVDSTTTPVRVVVRPKRVLDSRDSPYEATVAIESTVGTGVPQRVHVTYKIDVGRAPVIELKPAQLEFRRPTSAQDVVPAQTVEITNSGSRTLRELSVADSTSGGPVDWLFVLLDSRIAPATLTVAIKPAEAAATQRNQATLEITGEDAESRRLTVVLREGG